MFRFLRFFAGAAIAATLLAVPFMISSAVVSTNTVSVIVEFRDDPGAVYAAKLKRSGALPSSDQIQVYRNNLSATQNQFLNALKSSGIDFQLQTIAVKNPAGNVAGNVALRYSLVYNGMALTVPEAAVPTIANMSGVKKVHPNEVLHPDLYKSVPYIRANLLYGNNRNDLGVPPPPPWMPDGNEGQNVVVAVIDTGIDWTHPMFGGDPTPPRLGILPATNGVNNQKVIYQLPLADVITDGFGHGTHVSSTIAGYLASAPGPDGIPGTADDIPLHGVAPQAKLMSYKVCSDALSTVSSAAVSVGGCFTSNIVMAIEDAVSPTTVDLQPKPVADVISMSLGGGGGPDEATAVASDNATLLGCSVVAAAGNDGSKGEGTLGSPASGRHVIAVAASNDPADGNNTIDVTDGSRMGMNAFPLGGSAPITADVTKNYVFCGLGEKPTDFPASVAGNIALIQRGSTLTTDDVLGKLPVTWPVPPPSAGTGLFATKVANATAAGAVAVVVYNNVDGEITAVTAYKTAIPAIGMSKANGEFLTSIIGSDSTGLSAQKIRINKATVFTPSMATFSSRGPVQGSGQVKPDVSAPGVNILAAAPTASTVWALAGSGPMYATISGTSMATPHTSGAVALIRNAHLDWTPDVIRTAMINTATNLRSESQVPQADGLYSILSQGGGLIDVYHAVNIKALMGEAGDGIAAPSILGSHSYGEVPVVNNRVTSTQSVTVTIQDLSGQGGTYNLGVANSQDVAINGIGVTTSPSNVNVPANGSATFTVSTTFDGNLIRDPNISVETVNGNHVTLTPRPIETQWYVTAQRSDGGESLRMPFYYKPVFSVPVTTSTETTPFSGSIAVGDLDLEAQPGVDFMDFPLTVDASTVRLDAELNYFPVVTNPAVSSNTELDLYLLDPNGTRVAQSINDGLQRLSFVTIGRPGTYHLLVDGDVAANTAFTLNTTRTHGNALPPAVAPFTGDFVDAQGNQIDFDGNVPINWAPNGGEQGFEIEQTSDDKDSQGKPIPDNQKNWQIVGDVGGSTTSFTVTGLTDGLYFFRVRAIYPGQIGMFVTAGSNSVKALVSARTKVDITSQVTVRWPGTFDTVSTFTPTITNNSTLTYVPYVDMNIVAIHSGSGTVKVTNAENGKDGTSQANAALFGYTSQLGADGLFTPSETTGGRTVKFQNNLVEMFTADTVVTAYLSSGAGGSSSSSSSSSQQSSSGSSGSPLGQLTQIKALLRFTFNPLTKTVTSQLIKLQ